MPYIEERLLPASVSACSVFRMETIPAPTKKKKPCKEAARGKEAQEDNVWMGRVAIYEHFSHSSAADSSRTFYRGSGRGPSKEGPAGRHALPLLATAAMHWPGAQWEEHVNASIQDMDGLPEAAAQPTDTSKQPSVCTGRKGLCCNREHNSPQHVGISSSGSLLDIYGRLDSRRLLFFFFKCSSCVSQNRRAERKSRCFTWDSRMVFVWVEDKISCSQGCTHEDQGNY